MTEREPRGWKDLDPFEKNAVILWALLLAIVVGCAVVVVAGVMEGTIR